MPDNYNHLLLPPVKKLAEGVAWDYERLVKLELPTRFENPDKLKVAPRQQGNRGTCVGQASAALRDYLYLKITKDKPTGIIQRNVRINPSDIAVRDILYDQSFSAQCIYEWSRKEGGVTEPAGSYCNAAIRALYKVGCCLEKQWWTSKEARAVWAKPFPSTEQEVIEEGAKHKIEGYAALRSVFAIKEALVKHGVCVGAINIYENYMAGQIGGLWDGNLPDPTGACVGSHALCFIGYDDSEQRLYFRHSWDGWTEFGSISYRYWEDAGGDFWVALDENEAVIGQTVYKTVTITSDVEAEVKINGAVVGKTPYKTALEIGRTYTIEATVGDRTQVNIITIDDKTETINFAFKTESPLVSLIKVIIEFILSLFGRK